MVPRRETASRHRASRPMTGLEATDQEPAPKRGNQKRIGDARVSASPNLLRVGGSRQRPLCARSGHSPKGSFWHFSEVAGQASNVGLSGQTGSDRPTVKAALLVESRCGAVALGRTYLLPPLSSGGASIVPPWLRFHIPLIEPDRQISRIRLSDKTSRFRVQRHLQLLNIYWS
jgi:hypothetical protein